MECGHTCGIERHKHKADRTLLFEYMYRSVSSLHFMGYCRMVIKQADMNLLPFVNMCMRDQLVV